MIKNLRKIKQERSGYWPSFAIQYTETAIIDRNDWKYKLHDPRLVYDNQLSLIRKYRRVGNNTRFEFAVHDQAGDSAFDLNNKKILDVYFEHYFGVVYATLYYGKTIQEIRKEKLSGLFQSDELEPLDNILKIEDIVHTGVSA